MATLIKTVTLSFEAAEVQAQLNQAELVDQVGEIDFVLTVGTATRTGTCKPTQDVPFGGNAGSPLQFSLTLDVVGTPTDGVVTP